MMKFVEFVRKANRVLSDENGNIAPNRIIMLFVTVFLGGILLPTAITQFETADTTNWSTNTVLVWGLIPMFIALGVALSVLPNKFK